MRAAIERHKLPLALAAIGALVLLVGIVFPNLNDKANGFVGNLFAEFVGIFIGSAITVAVIDELVAERARRDSFNRSSKHAEGLLLDVAARALWGSNVYVPGAVEAESSGRTDVEPWRAIIAILSRTDNWNSVRLCANEPAPDELTWLSPRIWDVIAVPPEEPPSLNVARKTVVVAACADDLERIATEFIPEVVENLLDARKSSAVITHWVNVLRHTHLNELAKADADHFFGHVAGAIWEVLFVLDESFHAIPHPVRNGEQELLSAGEIDE